MAMFRRQPFRQAEQIFGRGLEGADRALNRAAFHVPHAGHNRVLVHIQTGAVAMKNFHVSLLPMRRRRGIPLKTTLETALLSRCRPMAQSGVLRSPRSN